jgi:hypothetical protein
MVLGARIPVLLGRKTSKSGARAEAVRNQASLSRTVKRAPGVLLSARRSLSRLLLDPLIRSGRRSPVWTEPGGTGKAPSGLGTPLPRLDVSPGSIARREGGRAWQRYVSRSSRSHTSERRLRGQHGSRVSRLTTSWPGDLPRGLWGNVEPGVRGGGGPSCSLQIGGRERRLASVNPPEDAAKPLSNRYTAVWACPPNSRSPEDGRPPNGRLVPCQLQP